MLLTSASAGLMTRAPGLYLNVYTPYNAAAAKTAALPVLFWINGGGWQGGGGDEVQLNGTWDASLMREQLIVVTHNYRLGIFGFLGADELRSRDVVGGSTGNYGIQDQRAAMQWVNANIAAFGGDPKRVFMVGNSAGSAAVSVHLTSKASWPYFSAAGLESGPYYLSPQVSSTTPVWEGLLAYLKCGNTAPVDCVLKQSTASLLAANTYLRANGPCTTGANGERIVGKCGWGGPLIDGVEMKTLVPLAMYQGLMANVPILIGANREDIENTAAATAPSNRKVPPMCNPQTCSEQDFRAWGVGLGFDAATVDAFVQVYSDEENGIPSNVLVYLLATFAERRRGGGVNGRRTCCFFHPFLLLSYPFVLLAVCSRIVFLADVAFARHDATLAQRAGQRKRKARPNGTGHDGMQGRMQASTAQHDALQRGCLRRTRLTCTTGRTKRMGLPKGHFTRAKSGLFST